MSVNDGTGPGAFYGIMEQEIFPSHCVGAGDILRDVIGNGTTAIQQVVLHVRLLVPGIGDRFFQAAPTCGIYGFKL